MFLRKGYFTLKTAYCLILTVMLFILFSVPAYALPVNGIETETLVIPVEYHVKDEDAGDIGAWEEMSETDKRFYIKHSVVSALSYFMAGINSPEREFMVLSGWNDKLALEAYRSLKEDAMFVENIVFRTDRAVAEYFKRCDIVMTTVLCRSGIQHCYVHQDGNSPCSDGGECEIYPVPSLWQISVYQSLMEIWSSVSLEA